MTKTRKRIDQLECGDLVDLQNDQYADPDGANHLLEYEYAIVNGVESEGPDCTAVSFEGFDVVGFPPSHIVTVK